MRKLSVISVAALLLLFTLQQQVAAKPYVGASYNYDTASGVSSNADGWGVQAGMRVIGILGVELGYIDFGSIGPSLAYVEADGWTLSGALYLPIPVVDLYARGGYIRADVSGNIGDLTTSASSENKAYGGLGAGIKLGPVSAFLEWDRYFLDVVDIDSTKVGVNLFF